MGRRNGGGGQTLAWTMTGKAPLRRDCKNILLGSGFLELGEFQPVLDVACLCNTLSLSSFLSADSARSVRGTSAGKSLIG